LMCDDDDDDDDDDDGVIGWLRRGLHGSFV
jgi:hypothetical protein